MDTVESDCNDVKMLPCNRQESHGARRSRLLKQVVFVIISSMSHFSMGSTLTWPSPALSDLALNNITLVGTELVLTPAQIDMTGSLMLLGTLFGAWAGGALVTRLGPRRSLQVTVAPILIGCVAIALAPNAVILLGARLVLGFGCGSSSVAGSLYAVEIADVAVRGAMGIISTMAIVLGGLFTVSVGCVVSWYHLALVGAIAPSILLVGTFFISDSPGMLVLQGKNHEAMIVLRKLRGPHADLHSEIETIEMKNSCRAGGWQKLLSWYMAKRVATIVMLFAFQQFCGNYVFIVHTARILRKMGIPWDADRSTIIVAAVRIVGTLVSISIVDRVGRRTCLIASHAITLASLTTLGIFVYLAEAAPPENTIFSRLAWVPLFCLVLVMFGLHVGAHPVPFVLAAEYFPTSVRGQTFSVCYSSGMLFGFLVLQFYSPMLAALTQPGLYWFYAAVSTLAVAFTFIFVEETKGKNIG